MIEYNKIQMAMKKANIRGVIGDYQVFAQDLFSRLEKLSIDIVGWPISHLSYRTTTTPEYEKMREELKAYSKGFVETQFNGRSISIFLLKDPLILNGNFSASVIELAAPRAVHMYPSGLEHLAILIGDKLPGFNKKHHKELTGIKEHGVYCRPSFITFDNGKTARFYDIPLLKIIELQGWKLEEV